MRSLSWKPNKGVKRESYRRLKFTIEGRVKRGLSLEGLKESKIEKKDENKLDEREMEAHKEMSK